MPPRPCLTIACAATPGRRPPPATPGQRATGATKMNEVSSRSHAVCIIIVEKCSGGAGEEGASQDALMGRPPAWAAGRGGPASPLATQQSIRVRGLGGAATCGPGCNLMGLAGACAHVDLPFDCRLTTV
jgi:hypothetical protein